MIHHRGNISHLGGPLLIEKLGLNLDREANFRDNLVWAGRVRRATAGVEHLEWVHGNARLRQASKCVSLWQ